jgi:hypothetical protein
LRRIKKICIANSEKNQKNEEKLGIFLKLNFAWKIVSPSPGFHYNALARLQILAEFSSEE